MLGRNPYNVSGPWQINGVCFAWDTCPWVCVVFVVMLHLNIRSCFSIDHHPYCTLLQ